MSFGQLIVCRPILYHCWVLNVTPLPQVVLIMIFWRIVKTWHPQTSSGDSFAMLTLGYSTVAQENKKKSDSLKSPLFLQGICSLSALTKSWPWSALFLPFPSRQDCLLLTPSADTRTPLRTQGEGSWTAVQTQDTGHTKKFNTFRQTRQQYSLHLELSGS